MCVHYVTFCIMMLGSRVLIRYAYVVPFVCRERVEQIWNHVRFSLFLSPMII